MASATPAIHKSHSHRRRAGFSADEDIGDDSQNKDDPDHGVGLEESAINRLHRSPSCFAVLEDQRAGNDNQRRAVAETQPGHPAKSRKPEKRSDVKPDRPAKGSRDTEADHQRMQALAAVDLVVLARIDQIKTRHPDEHRGGEGERDNRHSTRHGDPGPDRCDGQREAEEELRKVGESLCQRIEKNDRQRDRRKHQAEGIQPGCRGDKPRR